VWNRDRPTNRHRNQLRILHQSPTRSPYIGCQTFLWSLLQVWSKLSSFPCALSAKCISRIISRICSTCLRDQARNQGPGP